MVTGLWEKSVPLVLSYANSHIDPRPSCHPSEKSIGAFRVCGGIVIFDSAAVTFLTVILTARQ